MQILEEKKRHFKLKIQKLRTGVGAGGCETKADQTGKIRGKNQQWSLKLQDA